LRDRWRALETKSLSLWWEPEGRAPLLGTLVGKLLSHGLRKSGEIFLYGELLMGNPRDT